MSFVEEELVEEELVAMFALAYWLIVELWTL